MNQIIFLQTAITLADDSNIGLIFEVDMNYPGHQHVLHNEYPLAPERLVVQENMLITLCKINAR